MPVSKNPFSLYDFLGYFVPGAFMLLAVLAEMCSDGLLVDLISRENLENVLKVSIVENNPILLIAFFITAYIFGHFLSYLSSVTIEVFSNRLFQYPSKYLLGVNCVGDKGVCKRLFASRTIVGTILLVVVYVVCFPVTLPMTLFAKIECIKGYLTRALDDDLILAIEKRILSYSKSIGYEYKSSCFYCDSHRLIMHFVNINIPNAMRKVDNYVALYGFLRSMSLALSLVFIIVFISAIRTIDFCARIEWPIIFILCVLFVAPSVAYLGYLKFYRRHTLENFMAFLVAPIDIDNDAKEMLKNKYEKEVRKNVTFGVSFLSCKK